MSHKRKEIREIVSKVLDDAGVQDYTFSNTGSGHQKVSFVHNGKRCSYVFASTASDRRTVLNTKSGVRRMLMTVAVVHLLPAVTKGLVVRA